MSDSKITINLSEKFLKHFGKEISSVVVSNADNFRTLIKTDELIDVLIIEQTESLRFNNVMKELNRYNTEMPVILMSREYGPELMASAINEHVDNYLNTEGKEPAEYYEELVDLITYTVERHRVQKQHVRDTNRYAALVELAKFDQFDFQAIIDYALNKALELTDSKIGYVAFVNIPENRLTMIAWSQSALDECRIENRQMDFKLNEAGLWAAPVRTGKTVFIDDYSKTPHPMKHGSPTGHVEMKTLMMIPIIIDGNIIGTVGVGNKARDYTASDEFNVEQLFKEAFQIQQTVIAKNSYENELAIYRKILDKSPFGIMYVSKDGFKAICNNNAASILGLKSTTATVNLSDYSGKIIDYIIARVSNYTELEDNRIFEANGSMWSTSISKFNEEGLDGYAVIFTEVTNILEFKNKIDSDKTTLRLIEGLIGNGLSSISSSMKNYCLDDNLSMIYKKLDELSSFLKNVIQINFMDQSWVELNSIISEGLMTSDEDSLNIKVNLPGIKVFASHSLIIAVSEYKRLIMHRCPDADTIEIGFGIQNGNLMITLSDNGTHPLAYSNNQAGMFYLDPLPSVLLSQICKGNGMELKWVRQNHSFMAEITIPPERYKIGF